MEKDVMLLSSVPLFDDYMFALLYYYSTLQCCMVQILPLQIHFALSLTVIVVVSLPRMLPLQMVQCLTQFVSCITKVLSF